MSSSPNKRSRRSTIIGETLVGLFPALATARIDLAKLRLNDAAVWFLIAILAWAPFPLGSNRAWSWSLLALLIAVAWLLWVASEWKRPELVFEQVKPVLPAVILALLPLAWGV